MRHCIVLVPKWDQRGAIAFLDGQVVFQDPTWTTTCPDDSMFARDVANHLCMALKEPLEEISLPGLDVGKVIDFVQAHSAWAKV